MLNNNLPDIESLIAELAVFHHDTMPNFIRLCKTLVKVARARDQDIAELALSTISKAANRLQDQNAEICYLIPPPN